MVNIRNEYITPLFAKEMCYTSTCCVEKNPADTYHQE
jgi:hypothetical protein